MSAGSRKSKATTFILVHAMLLVVSVVVVVPLLYLVISAFKTEQGFLEYLFLPKGDGFLGIDWNELTTNQIERLFKGDIGIGRTAQTDRIETELGAYFAGRSARFETPLALHGTAFTRAVWDLLRAIPPGATRSYSEIALALGRPQAVRAVARANGANQIAIAIPCHRVIGADGSLTGYGGGLWRKERLIALERSCSQGTARESRRTPALPATP